MDIDSKNLKRLQLIHRKKGKATVSIHGSYVPDNIKCDFKKVEIEWILSKRLVSLAGTVKVPINSKPLMFNGKELKMTDETLRLFENLRPPATYLSDGSINYGEMGASHLPGAQSVPTIEAYAYVKSEPQGAALVEKYQARLFDSVFMKWLVFGLALVGGIVGIIQIITWISNLQKFHVVP